MTFAEMKTRLQTVLRTMDKLSCSGAMELKGLTAIQEMAGCSAILGEIANLESLDEEEKKTKTFR